MMYMKQILQLYVLIGRILSNFRHNISETLSVFAPSTSVSEQRTVVVVFPTDGSSDRFNDSRIHSCTYRHNSETCSKMGELASWPGVPLPFFPLLLFYYFVSVRFVLSRDGALCHSVSHPSVHMKTFGALDVILPNHLAFSLANLSWNLPTLAAEQVWALPRLWIHV